MTMTIMPQAGHPTKVKMVVCPAQPTLGLKRHLADSGTSLPGSILRICESYLGYSGYFLLEKW